MSSSVLSFQEIKFNRFYQFLETISQSENAARDFAEKVKDPTSLQSYCQEHGVELTREQVDRIFAEGERIASAHALLGEIDDEALAGVTGGSLQSDTVPNLPKWLTNPGGPLIGGQLWWGGR